jgi:hypothetical protein
MQLGDQPPQPALRRLWKSPRLTAARAAAVGLLAGGYATVRRVTV